MRVRRNEAFIVMLGIVAGMAGLDWYLLTHGELLRNRLQKDLRAFFNPNPDRPVSQVYIPDRALELHGLSRVDVLGPLLTESPLISRGRQPLTLFWSERLSATIEESGSLFGQTRFRTLRLDKPYLYFPIPLHAAFEQILKQGSAGGAAGGAFLPTVIIENGILEIVENGKSTVFAPRALIQLRDVNLTLSPLRGPEGGPGDRFYLHGSFRAGRVRKERDPLRPDPEAPDLKRLWSEPAADSSILGRWEVEGTLGLRESWKLQFRSQELTLSICRRCRALTPEEKDRDELPIENPDYNCFYELTAPNLRRVWNRYSPEGRIRVTNELSHSGRPGDPVRYRYLLEGLRFNAAYVGFPYRLGEIEGEIEFLPETTIIRGLESRIPGMPDVTLDGRLDDPDPAMIPGLRNKPPLVKLSGRFVHDGSAAGFRLRLEAKRLPLDDALRQALPPDLRKLWDRFNPEGEVHLFTEISRRGPSGAAVSYPIQVYCEDGIRFRYDGFPVPMEGVRGEIFTEESVRGENSAGKDQPRVNIEIKHLTGRAGSGKTPATVDINGILKDIRSPAFGSDVEISARDVRFQSPASSRPAGDAPDLLLGLPVREVLPEAVLPLWTALHPSGLADARLTVRREAGSAGDPDIAADIRLRGVDVRADEAPLPVEGVEGSLGYAGRKLTLEGITGRAAGGTFRLNGAVDLSGAAPSARVRVEATGIRMSEEVAAKFPDEIGAVLRSLRMSGPVDFSLVLSLDGGPDGPRGEYDLWLKFHGVGLDLDVPFADLWGEASLSGKFGPAGNSVSGDFRLDRVSVAGGRRLTGVTFHLVADGGRVTLLDAAGSGYGGNVRAFAEIETGSGAYRIRLDLDGMNLRELGGDAIAGGRDIAGNVRASADLRGVRGDLSRLTGRGEVHVTDGYLWEVPLFLGILRVRNMENPSVFNEGHIRFRIADRVARIPSLLFKSRETIVYGRGTVDFGGNIDLYLDAKSGTGLIPGPIGEILDVILGWLRRELFVVNARGPIQNPEIQLAPMPPEQAEEPAEDDAAPAKPGPPR